MIMESLDLNEGLDWATVGSGEPRRDSIEGHAPFCIHSFVSSAHLELVKRLRSTNPGTRKKAKRELESMIPAAFRNAQILTVSDR